MGKCHLHDGWGQRRGRLAWYGRQRASARAGLGAKQGSAVRRQRRPRHAIARVVAMHLQSMLVVCHAEPTSANRARLNRCIADAETVDSKAAGKKLASELKRLIERSKHLLTNSSSLRLPDVLVLEFANPQCVMDDWPGFAAGSDYLPKQGR